MADEQLRMTAEVVDKFSTPLRKLRDELKGVKPPPGVREIENDFSRVAKAAGAAANEIRSGIGTALTGLGFGAITASGAIAGLIASIRGFSSATATLAAFSRETGLSVERLRALESLGERFQIAPDQMKAGVQQFAANLYDIRRRFGETYGWLQAASPKFAEQLFNSKTTDEALGRAFAFLSKIEDPIKRMRTAEKLFGNAAIGRLGAEGLDKLMKQWAEVQRDLGKLPPDAAKSAEEFERSMKSLGDTLRGIRDASAVPVIKEMNEALKELGDWVRSSGFAKWLGEEIRQTVRDFKDLIQSIKDAIEWLGKAKSFLGGNGADGKGGGNYGAAGEITPFLGAPLSNATGPMFAELKRKQDQLARLEENIQRREGNGQDATETKRKRDQLLDEIRALREKMRDAVRDGVKEGAADLIQKQSFGGGSGFGGLIQNASYGGAATGLPHMGGGGRFNGIGGGGGGGASGVPTGAAGAAPGDPGGLHSAIIAAEGTGKGGRNPYDTVLGYGRWGTPSKPLSSMTLDEVFQHGLKMRQAQAAAGTPWNRTSSASGAFQIVGSTMRAAQKALGLKGDELFNAETQQRMASWIAQTQGLSAWEGFKAHPGELARARAAMAGGTPAMSPSADLRVKPGAGTGHPGVMALAKMLQASGMVNRFTAFRDEFHKGRRGSLHNQGLAGDFSLTDPRRSAAAAQYVRETMRKAGLTDADMQVLDEYARPSRGATGGHMHYGFRSAVAADKFAAWARRGETESLARSGDAMMMRGAASQRVEGDAKLSIDLKGFPKGTAFSTEASGMFKQVHLDRGRQMAEADQ